MAINFQIDPEQQLVHLRMTGTLTNQDAFDLLAELRQHPDFKPHFKELADLRRLERNEVTGDALVQLARDSVYDTDVRRAIVVGNDTDYGLARLYRLLAQNNPEVIELFWSMKEAREWLGLPPEDDK